MAHRKLNETIVEFHEFTGHKLSKVLKKVSKFAEKKEVDYHSLYLKQEWNEEDGFVVYVFVS